MPSPRLTKGDKTKAILWLAIELAKVGMLEKVMKEFKKRGLDIVFAEEIKEYQKYLREKKFAEKLDKQMKEEIERFIKSRK